MIETLPVPDFARVFDAAPVSMMLLSADLRIVHANRVQLEVTGTTLDDVVGRHVFEVFPNNPGDPHADGMRNLSASLEIVRATGRPHTMPIQKYDIRRADGSFEERFWMPQNVPVLDDDGQVVLLVHRADDVTDYVRDSDITRGKLRERVEAVEADLAERARELERVNAELLRASRRERRAAEALAGLADLVSELAAAETLEELFSSLFRHCDDAMHAAVTAVALRQEGATGDLLEVTYGVQGRRSLTTELMPVEADSPVAAAARGRRVLVPDGAASGSGPPELPSSPQVGLAAWAAVPLHRGEHTLGSLAFFWTAARILDGEDVRLLEAYAAQCAQAVERVRRLQQERERAQVTSTLAEVLQRSLLTRPPAPDHLQIAVRYRPATEAAHVGGDWYDAFVAPDGQTMLVIGDVTGHDENATAVMGQLRNMLRGIAHAVDGEPAHLLASLDRAIADLAPGALATALVAQVEQGEREAGTGRRTLRWSGAGHLPPLLLTPDGSAHLLDRPPDLILGLEPQTTRRDHVAVLEPGATVLLYTDGLVERRGASLDEGLAGLMEVAAASAALPLERLCDALLERLAPTPDDDVALVALRAHPQA